MDLLVTAVAAALLLAPGALVIALYLRLRAPFREALSGPAFRVVRGSWLAGAAALFAAPAVTLYSLRTTLGLTALPAPGLTGFRIGSWLVLGGFGLVLLGAVVAAVDRGR